MDVVEDLDDSLGKLGMKVEKSDKTHIGHYLQAIFLEDSPCERENRK